MVGKVRQYFSHAPLLIIIVLVIIIYQLKLRVLALELRVLDLEGTVHDYFLRRLHELDAAKASSLIDILEESDYDRDS